MNYGLCQQSIVYEINERKQQFFAIQKYHNFLFKSIVIELYTYIFQNYKFA